MRPRWLAVLALLLVPAPLALGEIVINEIMQNPSVQPEIHAEWFEVYNTGPTTVDMNGWTILDGGVQQVTIDNGGPLLIAPGEYLVLGNDANMSLNGGVELDYAYGVNSLDDFRLGNASDEIILRNQVFATQDIVEYDNGATFPDPNGRSMELIDPALDNNDGTNWARALTPFGVGDLGTPGAVNSVPEPGSTVLALAGLLAVGLLRRVSPYGAGSRNSRNP